MMSQSGEYDWYEDTTDGSNETQGTSGEQSIGQFDQSEFVRMSDGVIIPLADVAAYARRPEESEADIRRRHKMDTIVISSVAGLSAAALGLALRRLSKKP